MGMREKVEGMDVVEKGIVVVSKIIVQDCAKRKASITALGLLYCTKEISDQLFFRFVYIF